MALAATAESVPVAAQSSRVRPGKRLVYVDVLRAVAIITVIVHHLPEGFGFVFGPLQLWGGRGVDLFFALSGFLIGSTCLERTELGASRERQALGYWVLRVARIWPPYFLLLAVFMLGLPIFDPAIRPTLLQHPLPYLFFTSNYSLQGTLELGVLWSLAIEEQFYLAVGILILSCSQRRETLRAAFIGIAICAVVVAARYRFEMHSLFVRQLIGESDYVPMEYFGTISRMDQLAIGLLSAVVAQNFNQYLAKRTERFPRLATWAGIVICVAFLLMFHHHEVFGFTAIALVFSAAVLWAQRPAARSTPRTGLEARIVDVIANVGKLSFGLYLLHPVTRRWMLQLFSSWGIAMNASTVFFFLVPWFFGTWVIAALSYRFFESPLLDKARNTVRRLVVRQPEVSPFAQ